MKRLPETPHPFTHLSGCFLAGGSILSTITKTEVSDYDIYPKSKKDALEIISYLINDEDSFVVNLSDRAVTLKCNSYTHINGERAIIQIMMFDEFKTAEDIFDFFDFTICMAAFDTDSKEYIFHQDFFIDVASKTIRFNPKTRYPLNSMIRLAKYRKKGYVLPTSEMIRMCLTLIQSKLPSSWEELESAIGGTYGKQVRLNTERIPFSIENAIQLFDELSLDLISYDDTTDYSHVSDEAFDVAFGETKYYLYTLENGTKVLVCEQGKVSNVPEGLNDVLEIFKVSIPLAAPDMIAIGYKFLRLNSFGVLENITNTKKILAYAVGQTTEEYLYPHIYVYSNNSLYTPPNNAKRYQVEFKLKDIKTFTERELTVTKVNVVRQCD